MPHPSRHLASTTRLEAFSDGVIAVIITIMVLDLKVPREDGLTALYAILPGLGVYLLSFTFTGIYWINHHHLVHRIEEAGSLILYANLAFLFCLSLTPFFTAYVIDKHIDTVSVAIYGGSMVLTGFSFHLLRSAIGRRLRQTGQLEREDVALGRKHILSLVLYAVAIPLAFFHPHVALAVMALVTVIWITPTAGIKPTTDQQTMA